MQPKIFLKNYIRTPTFIIALLTIAKMWKQPKCPLTDEWRKKMWCIYTMEYYLAIKKHETLPSATIWMHFESAMLSEISQKEKDKYCTISLIRGLLKTNKISEEIKPNKNKYVDTENRAVVSREEGLVGGE